MFTIACYNKKFVIFGNIVNRNVRESSDNLLLGWKVGAFLELKVTDGAGKRKVAVDTAKVDETASGAYPRLFPCTLFST